MAKMLPLCLFGMSLLWGDINFDALEAKKPVQSSISMDFSDGVKAGDKQWKMKVKEDEARAAYIRAHYKPTQYSAERSQTNSASGTSSASNYSSRNSSTSSAKGVKKVYAGSKGAQGQNLYVIRCHNGRSISGVWKKSNGLWMSGSTSFGHSGMSLNQVAEDYCR